MASLAVKYRPKSFDEVLSQNYVKAILSKQLEKREFSNAYLFCGPSGDGKTTLARIFSKGINKGLGEPIEVDGASNNGVDNVRSLIEESKSRSLDSEYKTIIVDECHQLTIQAWSAFLKCLEEPPKYTVFLFCTTDPQKIPNTILNRLMRFNLTKVGYLDIANRLRFIAKSEGLSDYDESCEYIAKLANGGVRDAISMLEKCAEYSKSLSMDNVLKVVGDFSYDMMFDLTNAIIDGDRKSIVSVMDACDGSGMDVKLFVDRYMDFVLDLDKFCLFGDISKTKLPSTLLDPKFEGDTRSVRYTTGIENAAKVFSSIVVKVNELRYRLRYDDCKTMTATAAFVEMGTSVL